MKQDIRYAAKAFVMVKQEGKPSACHFRTFYGATPESACGKARVHDMNHECRSVRLEVWSDTLARWVKAQQ